MADGRCEQFGQILRRYRLAAGLSQEALAERAGLSARGISDLERGQRLTPHFETVRLLAQALQLTGSSRAELVTAARLRGNHPDDSSEFVIPTTRYAQSGDVSVAYQVVGNGPVDLVMTPGFVSNLEVSWEEPSLARYLRRLGSFSRLIVYDKRGTGLSDRVLTLPALEERMDDVRAVMDAAGSDRAALMGASEGGPMNILFFAATYPERVSALILYGSIAKGSWSADYPWGVTAASRIARAEAIRNHWEHAFDLSDFAPSMTDDEQFVNWFGRYLRLSASPGAAIALAQMNWEIDVRHILPTIRIPTLVLHRVGDQDVSVDVGRYIAAEIPDARLVELPGIDHLPFVGNQDALLDEVESFLAHGRLASEADTVLTTLLVLKPIRSTEEVVQREPRRFRGHSTETGDESMLATFDGPARAVRCAVAIRQAMETLGITIRAGVHIGEVELKGGAVAGTAVDVARQIATLADAGEILVPPTVKDLVAGSGLQFVERGIYRLTGVSDDWRCCRLTHKGAEKHDQQRYPSSFDIPQDNEIPSSRL